ncbi:MAG: bifunctional helix-turn-helix transcriptional regulator/GNAT family N-acetyltransferase [Solirubrobacterales bacterium]
MSQDIEAATEERVAAVRAFNRFYTRVIGLLREGMMRTEHSLTEARVIFELAHRDSTELRELREALDVDAGYLSRILGRFEKAGLASRARSPADGRRQLVRLTARGRRAFATLDERSAEEVRGLLSRLTDEDQRRLVGAMGAIGDVLADPSRARSFVLRPAEAGDLGWLVQRHGAVYARERGWDEGFEALCARIVAEHLESRDPAREATWVAEVDGERAGAVMCTKEDERVARLRLLLVEPWARGMGIGTRLVEECIRFAGRAGYERVTLWTNAVLTDARRIYERAGFELEREQTYTRGEHGWGDDVVGQEWGLEL